jgi:flagellar basal-body rod protein FlgB
MGGDGRGGMNPSHGKETHPLADVTMAALHAALNGLALRQRVISDNIANINTPGFLAGKVSFEAQLADALSTGSSDAATPVVTRSTEAPRQDGNNVNLDAETVDAVKTNLEYQTMVEAMNAKFHLLRTAIGSAS